jgi:small subunit ribosomal protein S20
MANTRQSEKRARQNDKRRARNIINRSATRTALTQAIEAVKSRDLNLAKQAYASAIKALSKAASKGAIPKTRAARKIARLTALVRKSVPDVLPKAGKSK